MRILMVSPSYSPIKGGAETLIRNLSVSLNQSGIRTDVLTFNMDKKWKSRWRSKIEITSDTCVYRVAGLNWFPFGHSDRVTMGINLIPGRFRKYLRGHDVIHFHVGDLTFPLFSLTVRKPKIAQLHGPLDFHKRYFLSRLILKNMADMYIAISNNMHKELVGLGVQPNRIKYLPNAVNTDVFRPPGNKEENLILFVGRITQDKGLHILLKSLHHLRTKIHVVVIGPPAWDFHYFQEMQNQMERENKKGNHRITYLGVQEQEDIAKWCQKASILVLPSFKEASPMTILEALSCGTPVVATNVGGIQEIVVDGRNGLLVSPNNSLELASSIQYLLDNDHVRTTFGWEGRRFVLQKHSFDTVIKILSQIYEEVSRT